jgi:hypothetical protein
VKEEERHDDAADADRRPSPANASIRWWDAKEIHGGPVVATTLDTRSHHEVGASMRMGGCWLSQPSPGGR